MQQNLITRGKIGRLADATPIVRVASLQLTQIGRFS
jgi:hypothetical protein